jgi:hypothetical protein
MEKLLNRENLLTKEELQIVKVDLGKDEFVYVRQMTGRERDKFEQTLLKRTHDKKGKVTGYEQALDDFRAKLAVNSVCDEQGNLLLKSEDYPQLSQMMSAARLEKIVNESQKLNAISEEDKEELVKNSEAAPGGNSSSDSVES